MMAGRCQRAFFSLSVSLVRFELFLVAFQRNCFVTPRTGQRDSHRLVEELKALCFFHRQFGTLSIFEDNKGLSFCLEVLLGDDVDDIAEFREDSPKRLRQRLELDAFLEILHVNTARLVSR